MEASTSECSSGCESGWTMYFDQYSDSADRCNRNFSKTTIDEDVISKATYTDIDQEDEDLSMLSDASSAPPPFISCNSSHSASRKLAQEKKAKERNSYNLDDTASSPVMRFSKDVPGFSRGLSLTDSKEKPTLRKQIGFFKPSVKGKSASEKSVGLQGRKK